MIVCITRFPDKVSPFAQDLLETPRQPCLLYNQGVSSIHFPLWILHRCVPDICRSFNLHPRQLYVLLVLLSHCGHGG